MLLATIILCSTTHADQTTAKSRSRGHCLLVWAGDRKLTGNDFLAVIDADPVSATYGRLVTTLATDQRTVRVHHTEYDGFVVLDIRDSAHPVEVSRLTLRPTYRSHWTAWDPRTQRLVATSGSTPEDRTFLLKLDTQTGTLSVDTGFRDVDR